VTSGVDRVPGHGPAFLQIRAISIFLWITSIGSRVLVDYLSAVMLGEVVVVSPESVASPEPRAFAKRCTMAPLRSSTNDAPVKRGESLTVIVMWLANAFLIDDISTTTADEIAQGGQLLRERGATRVLGLRPPPRVFTAPFSVSPNRACSTEVLVHPTSIPIAPSGGSFPQLQVLSVGKMLG